MDASSVGSLIFSSGRQNMLIIIKVSMTLALIYPMPLKAMLPILGESDYISITGLKYIPCNVD